MHCAGHAYSPEALGHVYRALTEHHKTLLVFKVQPSPQDPRQVVAFYIPQMFPEPGEHADIYLWV